MKLNCNNIIVCKIIVKIIKIDIKYINEIIKINIK